MLKCSKEAFAACPTRYLCGCPEKATFTEGSECDMFNQQIENKPMTCGDQMCNNCTHATVCGKCKATGGQVGKCEHFQEERHGRWEPLEYDGYADGNPVWDLWECSECREEHSGDEDTLTPYCPNCGARMDGGVENGQMG